MSRFARDGRVFVIEEPIVTDGEARLDASDRGNNVFVCVPRLPEREMANWPASDVVRGFVRELIEERNIDNYIAWFYTPMMLGWGEGLQPRAVIYDCMDELSGFKNAPPELVGRERELFSRADLVFTGGESLYEAKRKQHRAVYAFPSSIDAAHFSKAMSIDDENEAQMHIGHPRIGFVGVLDERLDIDLLAAIADLRPELNFIMVGPVVKIDEADLPRRQNIYYLGGKAYDELPSVLAGWDVAMMPFALNEATRYISPTKTPEYLAAGLPVVSTPIADVARPYGEMGLVHIAATPEEFVMALDSALVEDAHDRRERVADFLRDRSWDKTYAEMSDLIEGVIAAKSTDRAAVETAGRI